MTAIHAESYKGNLDMVMKLFSDGEDINKRNRYGQTPLMMALLGNAKKKNKHAVITYLLKKKTDVNVLNGHGDSALHIAIKASTFSDISAKVIRALVEAGADITLRNKDGKTPSQYAYHLGNVKIGDFLLFYDNKIFEKKETWRNVFLSCFYPMRSLHDDLYSEDEDKRPVLRKTAVHEKLRMEETVCSPKTLKINDGENMTEEIRLDRTKNEGKTQISGITINEFKTVLTNQILEMNLAVMTSEMLQSVHTMLPLTQLLKNSEANSNETKDVK